MTIPTSLTLDLVQELSCHPASFEGIPGSKGLRLHCATLGRILWSYGTKMIQSRFKKMAGAGRIIRKDVVIPNVSKKKIYSISTANNKKDGEWEWCETALTCPKIVPFTEKNHPHLEVNHTIAIAIHFLQQVYDSSMSQSAFDLRSKLVKWSVTIPNWFHKKELTEDMWGFKAYLYLNRDRMMCICIYIYIW